MKAKRIRRVCDAVQALPMFRVDESEGVFARHLVLATFQELFRFEYPELKWAAGLLAPISSNVHEGANEYSYVEVEHTGQAEIVADNADDLPRAEVGGRTNILPVKTIGCSFAYSTQEVRSAMMQGLFDIATEKAASARLAHDRKLDTLIRSGFTAAGLYGYTNVPGLLVASAVNGSWATATASDIVEDFSTAANTIINQSDGVELPNTALFPVASFTRISTLKNSDSSDITVLEYLKRAFPWITMWDFDHGMKTAGTGDAPAVLIYRKDPTRARVVVPMSLRPMPPQEKGLTFTVNLESRFGGVMAPKPRSILRLEGV